MARHDTDMRQIRQRGISYQVNVYAGIDPLTGRRFYLSDSSTNLAEARRIRNKFRAEVDEQRHARTNGTLNVAFTEWLRSHEAEPSTIRRYRDYLRLYIGPAFGEEPIGKVKPRVLESFYTDLRQCSRRCGGVPFVEHHIAGEHECRVVKHKRPPGRPPADGLPPHDCVAADCIIKECSRTAAGRCPRPRS